MALPSFMKSKVPPMSVDPSIVPKEVMDRIQTPGMVPPMVQQGEQGVRPPVPALPTETLYPEASAADEGVSDLTYEARPMQYEDEQRTDYDEQAQKLAEPTVAPDFSTSGGVFDILQKAREEIGDENYNEFKVGEMQRREFKDSPQNEARTISNYANSLQAKVYNNEGVFQNEAVLETVANDLGLNEGNMNTLGGMMLLASSRVGSDIRSRRYAGSVESESSALLGKENVDDGDRIRDLSFDSEPKGKQYNPEDYKQALDDIDNQPLMRWLVNSFSGNLGKFATRPQTPGGIYKPRNVSTVTGAAMALNAFEEGLLTLGKDKNGRYYPLITNKMEDMMAASNRMLSMYDVELRHLNINQPLVLSQSNPPVGLSYAGKASMFAKGGNMIAGNTNITEEAMSVLSSVGLTVNSVNYSLLGQMASHVQGTLAISDAAGNTITANELASVPDSTGYTMKAFSMSPYAESIADLSRERFIEEHKSLSSKGLPEGKVAATLGDISNNKITQVMKHVNDYIKNNAARGARFSSWYMSPSTGRMFMTATDVNLINHSGTIRPAMDFAVKYSARVEPNLMQHIDKVRTDANRIYDTSGLTGIAIGQAIHERLRSLPHERLVMMDAMYQIAKVAADVGYLRMDKQRYGLRPTPQDYIASLTPNILQQMATFGGTVKGWADGTLPMKEGTVELPPGINSLADLFEKKEWGPRISNLVMAHDLVNASKSNGGLVQLAGTIETDASQSNAFIMSLMIGDADVANILGNYVGGTESEALRREYSDLRTKVSSTIDEDIDLTFRGPDEVDKAAAIKNLMDTAREKDQAGFAKTYARGIVVAGLYGKYPAFMFTEVETMLSKMGLPAEIRDLEENVYKGDRQALLEDMASLYETSMRKHLANLQGYQRVMSAIGGIKAALNGSSKIKSFGNTEIDIGVSNVVPTGDETNIARKVLGADEDLGLMLVGRNKGLTASGAYGKDMQGLNETKERLDKLNLNILDVLDKLTEMDTHGDKARKTLPVVLIQSGDSYQMSSAIMYAHQGHKMREPLNVQSIHDATITSPGSTLLMYNAYNNISPYIMAANTKGIFESLANTIEDDFKAATKQVRAEGRANIGELGNFKALSGFFNRIYIGSKMESRQRQRGRILEGSDEDKMDKASKVRNEKILNRAIELGWLPPTERNAQARNNLYITPREWEQLTDLMLEASGWLKKGDLTQVLKGPDARMASRHRESLQKFIVDNRQMVNLMAKNKNQIVNMK